MPIQFPGPDRSAEYRLRGYESLAGGIGGAGQSIGQAIERYQEQKKKKEEELKRVLAADKAMMSFADALSDDVRSRLKLRSKLEYSAMKAGDPTAEVSGALKALGAEETMAGISAKREEAAARKAAAANTARFPAFATQMGRYAPPGDLPFDIPEQEFNQFALPEGQTQPGPTQLFQALSRSGYNPGNETDSLLRALQEREQAEAFFSRDQFGRGFPVTTPEGKAIPGLYTTPLGPRQSQVVSDPSVGLQTQQIADAQGNVHTVMVPPRGQPTELRAPTVRGAITPLDEFDAVGAEINAAIRNPAFFLTTKEGDEARARVKELRAKQERLLKDAGKPKASPDAGESDEAQAREAMRLQPQRAAQIRALYKQRTGKDLP